METQGSRNHLADVVAEFEVAMLVTHTATAIHARPMALTRLGDDLDAYLVTDTQSLKLDEISANPHALLCFQSARRFASVSGVITVMHDRDLIEALWKDSWKLRFPAGKSDPNIALLKFTANEGEFWDNAGLQGLKYVYDAAKAYVAGKVPQSDERQHAKVSW